MGWGGFLYLLSSQAQTHGEVELGCDNMVYDIIFVYLSLPTLHISLYREVQLKSDSSLDFSK